MCMEADTEIRSVYLEVACSMTARGAGYWPMESENKNQRAVEIKREFTETEMIKTARRLTSRSHS